MSWGALIALLVGYVLIGDAIGRFKLNVWLFRYRHEAWRFLAFPFATINDKWKAEEQRRMDSNIYSHRYPEMGGRALRLVSKLKLDVERADGSYMPEEVNDSFYIASHWLLWPFSVLTTLLLFILLSVVFSPVLLEKFIGLFYKIPSKAVEKVQDKIEEKRTLAAKVRVEIAEEDERQQTESMLNEEIKQAEQSLAEKKTKLEQLRTKKTYRR